jgi:hypothetical protein
LNGGDQVTDGNGGVTYVCNGTDGAPGVTTAGPGGLNVTVVENTSAAVADHAYGEAIAYCPAAAPYVLGGGGQWSPVHVGGGGPYVEGSIAIVGGFPVAGAEPSSGGNGWSVQGFNSAVNTPSTETLTAWAVCAA